MDSVILSSCVTVVLYFRELAKNISLKPLGIAKPNNVFQSDPKHFQQVSMEFIEIFYLTEFSDE